MILSPKGAGRIRQRGFGAQIRRGNIRRMSTKAAYQDVIEPDAEESGFKLDDFLPYRLAVTASRVSRLMARRFDEDYGLAISEWRVLAVLGRMGTLSPSVVGELASMDKVKVSRAAASLVAHGFVKQSQDPQDGRGRLLRLTRKGVNTNRGLVRLARELEQELAAGLSRTDWSSLHRMLQRLDTHAVSLQPGAEEAEAAD